MSSDGSTGSLNRSGVSLVPGLAGCVIGDQSCREHRAASAGSGEEEYLILVDYC